MVELCQCVLDGRGVGAECLGTDSQGERGCRELWGIYHQTNFDPVDAGLSP